MKSRARRQINKWYEKGKFGIKPAKEPFFVGMGAVFVWPSKSGEFTHHVTTRTVRRTPTKEIVEYTCSCPGWFNSEEDQCWHVRELTEQWEAMAQSS